MMRKIVLYIASVGLIFFLSGCGKRVVFVYPEVYRPAPVVEPVLMDTGLIKPGQVLAQDQYEALGANWVEVWRAYLESKAELEAYEAWRLDYERRREGAE